MSEPQTSILVPKPQIKSKSNPQSPFQINTKSWDKKTMYIAMAFVVVIAIAIAIIVVVITFYGNQLKKCRNELEHQKRQQFQNQQMLENRLRQMDVDESMSEQGNNQGEISDADPNERNAEWLSEGTDPMGTRTKRDGAVMGDTLMDRELRTNKVRVQPGTMFHTQRNFS